ncbi:hypothetical protein AVEN_204743-1 [Araneus ventricosus]|uniref:Uncharacterized protein n=1 Tax=Araneus ventricosus TaxID=182803 RepID=A0A4Y2AT65_ARAVE|nr:hypothetical protein AVEN_204743-1 [Araneus ventricosus]
MTVFKPFQSFSTVQSVLLLYLKRAFFSVFLDGPSVFLTVSSAVSQSGASRLLEMNWQNLPKMDGVSVHLYDRDPSLSNSAALQTIRPTNADGYHKTSVQFPEQVFLKTNLTSSCLGYWIVYRLNDVMVTSNCLRSRPHWMHESRSSIGNLTLLDLMIPGTHNAGCFSPYNSQEDTLFTRYLFTQCGEENQICILDVFPLDRLDPKFDTGLQFW